MQYCESCQRLAPPGATHCPCGGALRPIEANDPVLLIVLGGMQADLVTPLLDDLAIPYSKEGDMGVAFTMRAGGLLETYRLYVPYGAYAKAHDLIAETFGEDPDIMQALL